MANIEHLAILKQGVSAWNRWRKEHPDIRPDLSRADLIGVNLQWANLSQSKLRHAKLHRAHLQGADLRGADLGYANLFNAHLRRAELGKADLSKARLIKANLQEAKLRAAYLHEAVLCGVNCDGAGLRGADLSEAKLGRATFRRADLTRASLVGAELHGAELADCWVYGISAWDLELADTIQRNLTVTQKNTPAIKVDDLEVAQFIHWLLKHQGLRTAINAMSQKGVLILGRFGDGGLELLRATADRLQGLGYVPIIFDFERPDRSDYVETVKTLVGLSRFVIVELSGPSVPFELGSTVSEFERPFALIQEKGRKSFFLLRDLAKYPWVLWPPLEFKDKEDLLALLPERIRDPAEAYVAEREKRLAASTSSGPFAS